MPFNDADNVGVVGFKRVKRSDVPGEAPAANELRAGELAMNAADGVMYVGTNDGEAATVPSIDGGANKIVVIADGDYQTLVDNTATVSTTLYIVTPD